MSEQHDEQPKTAEPVTATAAQRRFVAYHEAGHAVAALALGYTLTRVEVFATPVMVDGVPRAGQYAARAPRLHCNVYDRRRRGYRPWTAADTQRLDYLIDLAGDAAEWHSGLVAVGGATHAEAVRAQVTAAEYQRLVQRVVRLTWTPHAEEAIRAVAERLLEESTLDGATVARLVRLGRRQASLWAAKGGFLMPGAGVTRTYLLDPAARSRQRGPGSVRDTILRCDATRPPPAQ